MARRAHPARNRPDGRCLGAWTASESSLGADVQVTPPVTPTVTERTLRDFADRSDRAADMLEGLAADVEGCRETAKLGKLARFAAGQANVLADRLARKASGWTRPRPRVGLGQDVTRTEGTES